MYLGKYFEGLEEDLKKMNKKKLNPRQALKLAKEKHGKGNKKNEGQGNVRSVIHVDQKTGKAQVAYEVSLMVQTEEDLSLPVTLYDTDFNVIEEYDNLQHLYEIHPQGTGPGGNSKTGCYSYGQEKPLLTIKDYRNGICQYETEKFRVSNDLQGLRLFLFNTVIVFYTRPNYISSPQATFWPF